MNFAGECTPLSVDEITERHVADLQLDGESLVGLEARVGVLGEYKLGRGRDIKADDATHRRGVARSVDELLTISEGGVLGQAEVDEVVLRGQGADLARIGVSTLTVLRQTGGNDSRVERCKQIQMGKWLGGLPHCRTGISCQMKTH